MCVYNFGLHVHAGCGRQLQVLPQLTRIDIRDGTTDFTRTIHFGLPTDLEREIYTRLLKGILAIEATAFPEGTTGIIPSFPV
jgi:hypothetical protein